MSALKHLAHYAIANAPYAGYNIFKLKYMPYLLVIFKSMCHVLDISESKFVIPIKTEMRPNLYMFDEYFPCYIEDIENINGAIMPGESGILQIRAIMTDRASKKISVGSLFELHAVPNKIASGVVVSIENIQSSSA